MTFQRSPLYQHTAKQSQHMLTHDYLLPYTMFLMSKLLPTCHIAITGFEVQAERDIFCALAVSLCNMCLMEREITLRVGPKQKKKTTKTRQRGEVFPTEAGRGCCTCTKQPLELFLGRSFGKPFHFCCNAQEPKSKVVLGFLSGCVLVLTRKLFCLMPCKRVTLFLPSQVHTAKWMLTEMSYAS